MHFHFVQIWAPNIQDLGVCDEVQCFEDVNIPDVDLTFRSFEELFGSEKEPINSFEDELSSFNATKFEVENSYIFCIMFSFVFSMFFHGLEHLSILICSSIQSPCISPVCTIFLKISHAFDIGW